jgi:hypothetical protein
MGGNGVPGVAVHPIIAFLLLLSFTPVLLRWVPSFLFLRLGFRFLMLCPSLLFFCWAFEVGLCAIEPLLLAKPAPKLDPVEKARWREVETFAKTNWMASRY